MNLNDDYSAVRRRTEWLCRNLETEDYVVQPVADVSPPKWHLGHTTWFFETFVLIPNLPAYREFHPDFSFVFNSYYESLGSRVIRADRGNLSRPTVQEIFRYRKYVDDAMTVLLTGGFEEHVGSLVILGLNHEQQHQELL
ncbi:MAG TPA: DinB family protein, partial [Sphingobacteriaceae bacterium]